MVAAVVSYEYAYALVGVHGESGWTARLIPLTGQAGLCQFDGDARLGPPGRAGACASAVAARAGGRGGARRERRPRPAGTVPSIRVIRARLHVGQPRAQRVRAHIAAAAGQAA